jgi:AmpD protein
MKEKDTDAYKMRLHLLPSAQYDSRPPGSPVDTLVIHSMYAREYADPFDAQTCKDVLDECGVSAHYVIDRPGEVWQLVDPSMRAWHAGESRMPFPDDTRPSVNAFSVGVELIANETSGYTPAQLESAVRLVHELTVQFPLLNVVGHCHIAPHRKSDPWAFDWNNFKHRLESAGITHLRLP